MGRQIEGTQLNFQPSSSALQTRMKWLSEAAKKLSDVSSLKEQAND
jgi:hypothetical protein